MASAIAFIQWESYWGASGLAPLFSNDPLTFNSRQERLHELAEGDQLWLVSRSPNNQQYYFVATFHVLERNRNTPGSPEAQLFGEYSICADRTRSLDLGSRFPAEGLLRAFEFETGRPIKHGASIGQSLQTIRFLSPDDEEVLSASLTRILAEPALFADSPCGLWTKCDSAFAEYFVEN
jgi:hypothetical protein